MIYQRIEDLIGQTPLLKLDAAHYGLKHVDLYIKLEYLNPFGSIKDRTVRGILPDEMLSSLRKNHVGLIESSSGNTAKALQVLANRNGLAFTSVTNRIKIPEVEQVLRYLGTSIVALPGQSECADPNNADDAVGVIKRMVQDAPGRYYHTSQYTNRDNTKAHEMTTAREVYDDLGVVDAVVMSVGTGGSSGGFIEYARHHARPTKHIGVVAHPSDFIPGIRTYAELFETELFHQTDFDKLHEVTSAKALEVLGDAVRHEGILAGPTTGANLAGLFDYARSEDRPRADGSNKVMVTVACDRLETYMSYIMKRQPELFAMTTKDDIFTVEPTDDEVRVIEKEAHADTIAWIADSRVLVIDTRGVKPYTQFHIAGSLNYPEEYLREVLVNGSPFPADAPLLFVCPRGDRSQLLAAIVTRRGIPSYSLSGGLLAWRNNNLPFVRKED